MDQVGKRLDGKHIVFRADGGFARGIGHLMRCLALAQAVTDIGGRVMLVSKALPDLVDRQYRAHAMNVLPVSDASLAGDVCALKADCLVFDSYDIDAPGRAALAHAAAKIAVIDDACDNGPYAADLLINPNPGAALPHYSALPDGQIQALGADYVLLRQEVLQARQTRFYTGSRRILVSCGGSDPAGAAQSVLKSLAGYSGENLHIKVLLGPAADWASLETGAGFQSHEVEFLQASGDIQALLNWADVAVLAAGTSQWEAAYLGCPFIALMIADNQVPGATFFADSGGSIALDWRQTQNEAALLKSLTALLSSEGLRTSLGVKAQALIDGQGAARLAQRIAQIV